MTSPKNYREVGVFDVLNAPLNPIGAFNAEQFKLEALAMAGNGSRHVVLDLGQIDFLYSDAFNALMMVHHRLVECGGDLGVLTSDAAVKRSLAQSGVDRLVRVYAAESDLMEASLEVDAAKSADAAEPVSEPMEQAAAPESLESLVPPPAPLESEVSRPSHKFAQSFNSATAPEATDIQDEVLPGKLPRKHSVLPWVLAGVFLVAGGGLIAFLLLTR